MTRDLSRPWWSGKVAAVDDMQEDDIWAGFSTAVVRIRFADGPRRLEPRPSGEVGTFPFRGPMHIITAFNPAGVLADAAANERRHAELREALDGLRVLDTVGSAPDETMVEPGFGVLGIELERAVELGRRFGQLAIYRWTAESLSIVALEEDHRIDQGWELR